jgi:hypothetical protein
MHHGQEVSQAGRAPQTLRSGGPHIGWSGPQHVDAWVRQTLVAIGLVFRAAHLALHYEIGRVISGTDRPHGNFPSNRSCRNISTEMVRHSLSRGCWMVSRTSTRCRSDRPSRSDDQTASMSNSRRTAALSMASNLRALLAALGARDADIVIDLRHRVPGPGGPSVELWELVLGGLVLGADAGVDGDRGCQERCVSRFL